MIERSALPPGFAAQSQTWSRRYRNQPVVVGWHRGTRKRSRSRQFTNPRCGTSVEHRPCTNGDCVAGMHTLECTAKGAAACGSRRITRATTPSRSSTRLRPWFEKCVACYSRECTNVQQTGQSHMNLNSLGGVSVFMGWSKHVRDLNPVCSPSSGAPGTRSSTIGDLVGMQIKWRICLPPGVSEGRHLEYRVG